eukprot:71536-Rhodomonas_salina.1
MAENGTEWSGCECCGINCTNPRHSTSCTRNAEKRIRFRCAPAFVDPIRSLPNLYECDEGGGSKFRCSGPASSRCEFAVNRSPLDSREIG